MTAFRKRLLKCFFALGSCIRFESTVKGMHKRTICGYPQPTSYLQIAAVHLQTCCFMNKSPQLNPDDNTSPTFRSTASNLRHSLLCSLSYLPGDELSITALRASRRVRNDSHGRGAYVTHWFAPDLRAVAAGRGFGNPMPPSFVWSKQRRIQLPKAQRSICDISTRSSFLFHFPPTSHSFTHVDARAGKGGQVI